MPSQPSLEDSPFTPGDLAVHAAAVERGEIDGEESPIGRWSIDGLGAAEWAMAQYAAARSRLAALDVQAAVWHDRINTWLAAEAAEDRRFLEFLRGHLEDYAIAQREAGAGATLKVPSGKVTTREAKARPTIIDADTVLEWLDSLDEIPDGAIKRTPLISGVKKVLAIVNAPTGRIEFDLACGHRLVAPDDDGFDDPEVEDLPDRILCPLCGEPARIERWTTELAPRAIDVDGVTVPGIAVEPAHVTASVHPNDE